MNVRKLHSASKFLLSRWTKTSAATVLVAGMTISGGAHLAYAGETLHVVEREVNETTIHLGAKRQADSLGDMIVFANPVFNAANERQLGTVQGSCVRVVVGKSWECVFSLVLGSDHMSLEGPYADTGESVFAITGGTGRYAGAKGQMSLRTRESKPGATTTTDMIYDIR
jgi:allene oxide cyclase